MVEIGRSARLVTTGSILILVAACGGSSTAPVPEPVDNPVFFVERSVTEVIDGECEPGVHTWLVTVHEEAAVLRLHVGSYGHEFLGTMDPEGAFSLNGSNPQRDWKMDFWTVRGSFSEDRRTLGATEEFRGDIGSGLCHFIGSWSGTRV